MTKINDRFEFERDKYSWMLVEWVDGKNKNGDPKKQKHETYHSTIEQICHVILDRSAEGKTVEDIVDAISNAKRDIKQMILEYDLK
jgi:hypothetical protein